MKNCSRITLGQMQLLRELRRQNENVWERVIGDRNVQGMLRSTAADAIARIRAEIALADQDKCVLAMQREVHREGIANALRVIRLERENDELRTKLSAIQALSA